MLVKQSLGSTQQNLTTQFEPLDYHPQALRTQTATECPHIIDIIPAERRWIELLSRMLRAEEELEDSGAPASK